MRRASRDNRRLNTGDGTQGAWLGHATKTSSFLSDVNDMARQFAEIMLWFHQCLMGIQFGKECVMTETESNPIDEHMLISSDRVEGTVVYNREGTRLATVSSLMINKVSGQVEYAVLAFGGLFGLGSDHYPLPWGKLNYDAERHGYVVDLTREQMEGAPSHAADKDVLIDPKYFSAINGFYGVGPW